MKFRAHDTFAIRKGWLNKGLRNIEKAPDVFISKQNNPMDVLGIGANMVKSLRYWLQATGLTVEPNSGKRTQSLTPIGEIIYNNDPYFEETGSLWLVHYGLATNLEDATSWYAGTCRKVSEEHCSDLYSLESPDGIPAASEVCYSRENP